MDPEQSLADLKQISAQVDEAVIFRQEGTVVASTLETSDRAAGMATAAARLLEAAKQAGADEEKPVVQLEARLADASVVIVREGETVIAATTAAAPTIGLVMYDLRTCLGALAEPKQKPKKTEQKPKKKKPAGRKEAKEAKEENGGAAA